MLYYRFKTFTTSYYFPRLSKEQKFMYGLYSAYGGKLSKIYLTFSLLLTKYDLYFDVSKNCFLSLLFSELSNTL